MNTALFFAFQTLDDVYRRDAYCSIAMADRLLGLGEKEKKEATRLVLGVLQHEYEFAWAIDRLCAKQPKAVVRVLLKMGMYLIKYTDSMPIYACVNETVNLSKQVKKEYAGFVNATLKAYSGVKDELPQDPLLLDSVRYNLPVWLVKMYRKQYGEQMQRRFAPQQPLTHIRAASKGFSQDALRSFCRDSGVEYVPTPYGVLVHSTKPFSALLAQGKATVQALDSVYIAHALAQDLPQGDVLDLCAAPGGKSVLLKELLPSSNVVSCDLHPHRVALIEAYARRMGVSLCTQVCDGTVWQPQWADAFCGVLVDAPCTGLGVAMADPDILLRRTPQSVSSLVATQKALLANAARYVKVGGVLVYSTCSDLRQEDEEVVQDFLAAHPSFVLQPIACLPVNEGQYRFIPDDKGNDGFFVARFRRMQ